MNRDVASLPFAGRDLASIPLGTRVFVDTCIFHLHYANRSASCTLLMERIARGEVEGYVNTQVLTDLLHKLMLMEAVQRDFITDLRATQLRESLRRDKSRAGQLTQYQRWFEDTLSIGLKMLRITKRLLVDTKEERATHALLAGDSVHLGTMCRSRKPVLHIATNDRDFGDVEGLTVWSPADVLDAKTRPTTGRVAP